MEWIKLTTLKGVGVELKQEPDGPAWAESCARWLPVVPSNVNPSVILCSQTMSYPSYICVVSNIVTPLFSFVSWGL